MEYTNFGYGGSKEREHPGRLSEGTLAYYKALIFFVFIVLTYRTYNLNFKCILSPGFGDEFEVRLPCVTALCFWWTHSRINSAKGELETVHSCFPPSLSETHSSKWTHRLVGRTTSPQQWELRKLTKNNSSFFRMLKLQTCRSRTQYGAWGSKRGSLAGGIHTGGHERVPSNKVLRSPWAQPRVPRPRNVGPTLCPSVRRGDVYSLNFTRAEASSTTFEKKCGIQWLIVQVPCFV